jgi:hypothetical protein
MIKSDEDVTNNSQEEERIMIDQLIENAQGEYSLEQNLPIEK